MVLKVLLCFTNITAVMLVHILGGATEFNIMTFSIMTLSIMDLIVTLTSIITLGISIKHHYASFRYAKCRICLLLY
jgi:hypothetical protein